MSVALSSYVHLRAVLLQTTPEMGALHKAPVQLSIMASADGLGHRFFFLTLPAILAKNGTAITVISAEDVNQTPLLTLRIDISLPEAGRTHLSSVCWVS
jgi:hypothetical protein